LRVPGVTDLGINAPLRGNGEAVPIANVRQTLEALHAAPLFLCLDPTLHAGEDTG
jgi:hypothetical protein